jgi:polyphenol oxidase
MQSTMTDTTCPTTSPNPFGLHFDALGSSVFSGRGVIGAMTCRTGGLSAAPWDEWNLGDHVDDDPKAVAENRLLLQQRLTSHALGLTPGQRGWRDLQLGWARQVHGVAVARLAAVPEAQAPQADALLTTEPGVVCCILVADCLPILLAHRRMPLVAAAHAGWRGLCAQRGVVETTLDAMAQAAGQSRSDLVTELDVWLGPCIGPRAFEVGAEVRAAFFAGCAADAQHFSTTGRSDQYWADLPALARARLMRAGVSHIQGNDGSARWCTYSNPDRYFSHRRDASVLGRTGRMAACIWIEPGHRV